MLDSFRNITKTWFGKVLGAFLIVGLAGFGISNVIFDIGTTTVAKVGNEEISTRDFQRAYSNELDRITQQFGQALTPDQAVAFGVPDSVLAQLGARAAVNQLADNMGIGVSDKRLGESMTSDPMFGGMLGQFDSATFRRVLQQNGFTEQEYLELQRRNAGRDQLIAGLLAGTTAPQAARQLFARYTGDTRSIDYFVVNAQSIPPVADPTEEELAAYLAEHQAEYRTQEARTVDLLVLTPEALAATKAITDEAVAAEYERTKDSRKRPERRHILQVPLTPEQVTAFEAGKQAGTSFDALVAEAGLTPIDLGLLSQTEVTDPQLAEAAFALAQGDFTIIPGAGGRRAVTVSAIEGGGEIPLEEVRDQIRQGLALAEARNEIVDILDQVEELRAAFRPLPEIAERFGLPVHTLAITAAGTELAGIDGVAESDRPRIAGAIFAADPDDKLAPTVPLGANRNAWFDLKQVEAARDQTLDEVRDKVTTAVLAQRTDAAMAAAVDDIVARLKAGEAFAEVAASLNQFPTLSPPLKRDGTTAMGGAGAGGQVLDPAVAAAAFAGGAEHFGSARNSDGDYVVFQVADVTPGEQLSDQVRNYLDQASQRSLFDDFTAGVRDQAGGVRVNRQVYNQILGVDATTGQ
ncbi:peptidylprolyl isomerase [Devosia sp.]|uniref:peptidylprolyl isomerase n=1 Tax=Devosia sp. TaxID=1871048 RepID=UPI002F23D46E